MRDRAVVVVLPEWPAKGTGGPLGFSYLLLKAILAHTVREFEVYVLATVCNQAVRLDSVAALQELVSAGTEARGGVRGRLTKYLFAKLPYSPVPGVRSGFARLRQWRRAGQEQNLQVLVSAIAAQHKQVVVHVHDVETGAKAVPLSRALANVSLVHTEHGKGGLVSEYAKMLGGDGHREPAVNWVRAQYEALFAQAQAVTFPSFGALQLFEEAVPQLAQLLAGKVAVIRTGIPLENIVLAEPEPERPIRQIFAIAQHVPEKGIDRMLRAVAACKQQGLKLQLRVAGAETVRSGELYALRDELGLQADVVFLGAVNHEQVMEELRNCDLYLACPRVVVFDLSLLEAMAVGVPIVTAMLPGNVEALGESYEGYFRNDAELPGAIASVLSDPERAAHMAAQNRFHCRTQFTLDNMVGQYFSLYAQVMDGRFRGIAPQAQQA